MKKHSSPSIPECLLTKEELAKKLNLPSTRKVDLLVARKLVPVIRLGHRTVRFRWQDVEDALDDLTVWGHTGTLESGNRTKGSKVTAASVGIQSSGSKVSGK